MNAILTDLPPWVDDFLAELAEHGLPTTAAAKVGTTERRVKALYEANSEFATAVDHALEQSKDVLELEAHRRAVKGVTKGIYFKGDLVATEQEYSDSLLTTLLKAKRQNEFGDKKQISGPGGAPLQVVIKTFTEQPTISAECTVIEHLLPSVDELV